YHVLSGVQRRRGLLQAVDQGHGDADRAVGAVVGGLGREAEAVAAVEAGRWRVAVAAVAGDADAAALGRGEGPGHRRDGRVLAVGWEGGRVGEEGAARWV